MEQDKLAVLLEKYWAAETSEEEEEELKEYFSAHPEAGELASLFRYFREEKQIIAGSGLDDRILSAIGGEPRTLWLQPLLKIVAVLAMGFFILFFLLSRRPDNPVASITRDTYEDPRKALQETKKALLLISQNLNAGSNYVGELKKINKAEEFIHINESHR